MQGLIESFPNQFHSAAELAQSIHLPRANTPTSLIVAGLGGSAIGGDLIRSVLGDSLRLPFSVCRDYRLPAYAGPDTALFACSYSGNTEETLSAYEQACQLDSTIICITSGGRLAQRAKEDGRPLILIPGGMPPRAALGYASLALLGAMRALDLAPDMTSSIAEAHTLLQALAARYRGEIPIDQNPAKSIAVSLQGKIAAVYGGSGLLDSAAARWRAQIEENAKNLALHHVLPEMNHNEILGWEQPERGLRHVGVVFLRDMGDHPQVQRRFDLSRQIVAKGAGVVHEVWSEGESRLARLFSVICLGDFVSLYLAFLNGVDPTRIDAIEMLKRKLGS
jgi:glucose/mannose-6-phosphate isomerase